MSKSDLVPPDRETSIQISSFKSSLYQYYLSALNLSYGIDDLRSNKTVGLKCIELCKLQVFHLWLRQKTCEN